MNGKILFRLIILVFLVLLTGFLSVKVFTTFINQNNDSGIVVNIDDNISDSDNNGNADDNDTDTLEVLDASQETDNVEKDVNVIVDNQEVINSDEKVNNSNGFEIVESTIEVPSEYARVVAKKLNGDDFTLTQVGNDITLDGVIIPRIVNKKLNLNSVSYINFSIYAPKTIDSENLKNLKVTLPQSGNVTYTQKEDKILENSNTSNPYFNIVQEFMNKQTITIIIDWGDGNPISYNLKFNMEVK